MRNGNGQIAEALADGGNGEATRTEQAGGRRETPVYRFPVQQIPGEVLEARSKGVMGARPERALPDAISREIEEILAQGGTAQQLGMRICDRARRVLEEAYESAAEVRIEAFSRLRQQLAQLGDFESALMGRATNEGGAIRAQAEQEAQLALQRAQRDADKIAGGAREEAERIVAEAEAQATAARARAQIEIRDIHASAAQALEEVEQRLKGMQEIEASFDKNAREVARWLGIGVEPGKTFFSAIRRNK